MSSNLKPFLNLALILGLSVPGLCAAAPDKATCAVVGVDTGPGVRRDTAARLAAGLSAAAEEQPSFSMLPYADAAGQLKKRGFDREVYDYPRTAYVMAGRMLNLHYVIYGKAKIEGSACILSTALARVWDGEVLTTKTTVLQGDLAKVLDVIPEQNMLSLLHSLHDVQAERSPPPARPTIAEKEAPTRVAEGPALALPATQHDSVTARIPKTKPPLTVDTKATLAPPPRPPESIATKPATEPVPTVLPPPERAPRVGANQLRALPRTENATAVEPESATSNLSSKPPTTTLVAIESPGATMQSKRPTPSDLRTRQRREQQTGASAHRGRNPPLSFRDSIAGRVEIGIRVAQFSLLENSMGAVDEFGLPEGTFIGTVNHLEEEQALLPPEIFIHFNFNPYIGIELAYDSLELKTQTVDNKSDGTLTMSGPIFSVIGRYPTPGKFTPYAGLGIALFGSEFDPEAHWSLGFQNPAEFVAAGSPSTPNGGRTRTMFVDDGTGVVLTGGCLWRFADDWAADAFARYTDVDSSAFFKVQVHDRTTTESTGTFGGENIAFGVGVRYAPR
ncbi:MAG: outer membrane beta-barrel protein [Verrucomicrobia bacterium]|nr:outer membrane beta-barrel protein [Verrucomicrobiota bacterium]MDA1088070.1 outer membrane beta-barrel protein [Verrucomicrobiota bacterium]